MKGYVDEADYLKQTDDSDLPDNSSEPKESFVKQAKEQLFSLFFRLNTLKIPLAQHYFILLIVFETFHTLSLLLNDGQYQTLGPYGNGSPWNLEQTQWLIDVCWVFRVDRYLRTSYLHFLVLSCLFAALLGLVFLLGAVLCWYQKLTPLSKFLLRLLKVCITLTTNALFIPICDTFAFGIRCGLKEGNGCLGISPGYEHWMAYISALGVFLGVAGLCSLLYFELCMFCGGVMSKPHSRLKLLRLVGYTAVVLTHYFVDTSGKAIVFLLVALCVGVLQCYVYAQCIPYYNLLMCKIRLASAVVFTSAAFCMLIGEFFNSTTQTTSSVTMLFYFLTPCMVQISHLALSKRCKTLATRKFQQLSNIYQVEIKGRLLVYELEAARSRSVKSMYGESEADHSFGETQTRVRSELETLYAEAFRKFPNSEMLYLWSGLMQLHVCQNYILAIVQCFKGQLLATKLDTQYVFAHFRRTSELTYKANMKDDAFEYVEFDKTSGQAAHNDEAATRAQYQFWSELEGKTPRIQRLSQLARDVSVYVRATRVTYTRLLKLNSKSTTALRMFGTFLLTLCNFAEQGARCKAKADLQDETHSKAMNAVVTTTLNQALSFFDADVAVMSISGDFETIGEIIQTSPNTQGLFDFQLSEMVGRNIAMLLPSPFSEAHDRYMKRFHESGTYKVIDAPHLLLYFLNKAGHLFECRALVKVLPNDDAPPFLVAALKPTKSTFDVAIISQDFVVMAYSSGFADKFDLGTGKMAETKLASLIPRFADLQESKEGVEIEHMHEGRTLKLLCHLVKLEIGDTGAFVLRVEDQEVLKVVEEDELRFKGNDKRLGSGMRKSEVIEERSESGQESTSSLKLAKQHTSDSESEDSEDSEESGDSEESPPSSEHSPTEQQGALDSKRISFASLHPSLQPSEPFSSSVNQSDPSSDSLSSDSVPADPAAEPHSSDSEAQAEFKPEGDGQSAYSSSKSVNSSVASQAQFLKGIKALVAFEFQHTRRYVLRFKVTLLFTIILLIVMSVTTFQVIGSSVQLSEELTRYVNMVGDQRLYSQSLAYYVRMIQLSDSGLFHTNRSAYLNWLQLDSDSLHALNLVLYKHYDRLGEREQRAYTAPTVPIWTLEGGKIRQEKVNLFDAVSNLILQSFLLGKEAASTPVNLTTRRPFYLYRNGMGETLNSLNASAEFYIAATLDNLDHQKLVSILLIMASVLLLVFCAGFAVIPTILTLERSKQEVWEVFFDIPSYVCRIIKGKCNDRLQNFCDTDNLEEALSLEHEEEEAQEDSQHSQAKVKPTAHRLVDHTRKVLAYDPRQRKLTALKLLGFFLISVVYFYLIYYTGFEAAGATMKEAPATINWASRRRQLSRAVNHWLTEAVLENVTSQGYKYIVTEGQTLRSPLHQAALALNELEDVENSLIFGNAEAGLSFSSVRGAEQESLLFTSACSAPLVRSAAGCPTIADGTLGHGLHSALGLYVTVGRTLVRKLSKEGNTTLTAYFTGKELSLIRVLDDSFLYDPLAYSSALYEQDYEEKQATMRVWQDLLIALYTVFALLFYVIVYHPMIKKVRCT